MQTILMGRLFNKLFKPETNEFKDIYFKIIWYFPKPAYV